MGLKQKSGETTVLCELPNLKTRSFPGVLFWGLFVMWPKVTCDFWKPLYPSTDPTYLFHHPQLQIPVSKLAARGYTFNRNQNCLDFMFKKNIFCWISIVEEGEKAGRSSQPHTYPAEEAEVTPTRSHASSAAYHMRWRRLWNSQSFTQ